MRITTILLSTCIVGSALAQDITEYRYWYNDDVANSVNANVTPAPTVDLTAALSTAGLEPGFHRITLQFSDGQDWSAPLTQVFKRSSSAITGFRYWFNDDPATLASVSVSPNDVVNLNDVLATVPSESDYNRVTLQFVDADGEYSAPITRAFVRGIGPVSAYEFWIDDDIAGRITGSIGPAEVVDLLADLPTNTTPGNHLFTIRFQGDPDGWSVPLTTEYTFYTAIVELPGLTDVTVFPNPTTESIGLQMTAEGARKLEVSVIDLKGALVLQFPTWNITGAAYQSWSLEWLSSGKYFLHIKEGTNSWTYPFVKN